MREIRALTGLRGAAALYVVVYHYVNFNAAFGPATVLALTSHGYISVDLFFVLSGFVMALSYGRLFEGRPAARTMLVFLGRRLARIYPLYAVVSLVLALAVLLGHSDRLHVTDLPTALPAALLMVQSWFGLPDLEAPMWSISTEWAAYLMFPLLLRCATGAFGFAVATLVVAVGGLVVLSLMPGWTLHHPARNDGPLSLFGDPTGMVGRCVAEFTLGLLAFRFARSAPGRRLAGNVAAGPVVIALIAILLPFPLSDLGLVACFALLIVAISADRGPVSAVLGSPLVYTLGVWSYAIYLVHPLVRRFAWAAGHALTLRHVPLAVASWGGLAAALPLLLLLAFAAHHLIEQPGRRAIQALITREWFGGRRGRLAEIPR